jgi:hypothetical protein
MLRLQATAAGSELSESLNEAASRITTVARAYDRLAYAADYETIDRIVYLKDVLKDLERAVSPNVIHFEAPQEISILAERAILMGLIINELVSNAGKYASRSPRRTHLGKAKHPGGLSVDDEIAGSTGSALRLAVRPPNLTSRRTPARSRRAASAAASCSVHPWPSWFRSSAPARWRARAENRCQLGAVHTWH